MGVAVDVGGEDGLEEVVVVNVDVVVVEVLLVDAVLVDAVLVGDVVVDVGLAPEPRYWTTSCWNPGFS